MKFRGQNREKGSRKLEKTMKGEKNSKFIVI